MAIGASTSVINQHRLPMAGHVLGLTRKPHPQLDLVADFEKALAFVRDLRAFRQESASLRINRALSGLPEFAALEGTGHDRLIQTVRGAGYRFSAEPA